PRLNTSEIAYVFLPFIPRAVSMSQVFSVAVSLVSALIIAVRSATWNGGGLYVPSAIGGGEAVGEAGTGVAVAVGLGPPTLASCGRSSAYAPSAPMTTTIVAATAVRRRWAGMWAYLVSRPARRRGGVRSTRSTTVLKTCYVTA